MARGVPLGGWRRKQLRSAVRTVRERRPGAHGHSGDPDIAALVEEPYQDVDEAKQGLQELHSAFEARDDRRAVFLAVYSRMTSGVVQGIRTDDFDDADWVADYLLSFANLYRDAVHEYETGAVATLPDPWQVAFETAETGEALVLQDVLLGVNAHINYDLALAVNDAGVRPDPETKYADHSHVTNVIADIIDEAQELITDYDAEGLAVLDESLGRLDERLTVLTIDECRDSAWRTAVALDSRLGPRRRLARWINDVTSTGPPISS